MRGERRVRLRARRAVCVALALSAGGACDSPGGGEPASVEPLAPVAEAAPVAETEDLAAIGAQNDRGVRMLDEGRLDEAQPLLEHVLSERRRRLGNEHPSTLTALNNVGELYRLQERYPEAEARFLEALEPSRRVCGAEHSSTLSLLNNLGLLYLQAGRLAEAEPLLVEALAVERRVFGDADPSTLNTVLNLGAVREEQKRLAEAEELYEEALRGRRAALGDAHPRTLDALERVANLYIELFRDEEAVPLFEELLMRRRGESPHDPAAIAYAALDLAYAKAYGSDYAGAAPLLEEALRLRAELPGPMRRSTLAAMSELASVYEQLGRLEDAARVAEEAFVATDEDAPERAERRAELERLRAAHDR